MDINTVTEIIKNVDPTQTTKYIGATVGGKMLYTETSSLKKEFVDLLLLGNYLLVPVLSN